MKKNSIFLSLILLGLFVFAACDSTEGELYQGENDKVGFIASATNMDLAGDFLKVPVGRTSTEGSLIVPVTLSSTLPGYTNAFKVAGDVTFAPGEGKAYVNIDYSNFATVDPATLTITPDGFDVGVSLGFPFSLAIQDGMLSPSKKGKATITALSKLEFQSAGKGSVDSSDGWEGALLEGVSYEKAKGVNAYKVVKAFSNYNFAFLIGSDGVSVTFPKQIISPNATYGPVSMEVTKAVYSSAKHAVTVTVSGYTVSAGSFGGGTEIFYLPK